MYKLLASIAAMAFIGAAALAQQGPQAPPAGIIIQKSPVPTSLGDVFGVRLEGYQPGSVFAESSGRTLYTYDRDRPGKPACAAACLRTWRPALVPAGARPAGDWSAVERPDDKSRQWAYKGKLLYTYVGDSSPGDAHGDNKDGQWHAAFESQPFRPAEVRLKHVDGRPVLADPQGFTLYTFDGDENLAHPFAEERTLPGKSGGLIFTGGAHCINRCADTWPPLLAPADAKVPPGGDWSVVPRQDDPEKKQWTFRRYPLYRYAGDKTPADVNGVNHKFGTPGSEFSVMFRIASTEAGRF